jgi:hypothetical protein
MSHIRALYKKSVILYDFLKVFLGHTNRDVTSCQFKWVNESVNIAIMHNFKDSDLKLS